MDGIIEAIRKKRTELGYSQEFVADNVGVDTSTYNRFESGKNKKTDMHLIGKVAEFLKMQLYISIGDGEPHFLAKEDGAGYSLPALKDIESLKARITVLERENKLLERVLNAIERSQK